MAMSSHVLGKICSLCACSARVTKLSWLCSSEVTYAKNCTSEEVSLLGLLELIMAISDHAPTLAEGQWTP